MWHSDTDLKWFREHTNKKVCIMGYNTFLSMGKYKKFFDNRIVFVLTSKVDDINSNAKFTSYHSVYFVDNLESLFIDIAKIFNSKELNELYDLSEIMVIGGQTIYNQFYKYCSKIYLTTIYNSTKGDAYFYKDLMQDWVSTEMIPYKEENGLVGMLEVYERIDKH